MPTIHDINIDKAAILIVDDESANLKLLSEMLVREGYRVRPANSPRLAIDSALGRPPDLVLLDVRMPEMDGFEVCDLLKRDERTRNIPILFISALQESKDKVRGFKAGGVDFITKPFQEEEVLARVRTHLKLRFMQRHLEELVAERTAELAKSEQLARSLLDATTDLTTLLDEGGTILDLNESMAKRLGLTREELVGTNVFDKLPPEIAEERRNKVRQALTEEKIIRYVDRNRPDVVFDAGIYPIANSAGKKSRVVIFAHDITEREKAEDALRASEKKLRESYGYLQSLTDALPDMVYSVSMPERRIAWINANAKSLGYDNEELIGRRTRFLYATEEDYMRFSARLDRTIETGGNGFGAEIALKRRDGSVFPTEVTVSLFRIDGELVNLIHIARDISNRKSREHQIQMYQQRLKALAARLTMSEEQERRRVAAVLHDHVGQSLTFARLQLASAQDDTADPALGGVLREVSDTLLAAAKETRHLIFDLSSPAISELGLQAAIKDWMTGNLPRHGIAVELVDHIANDHTLPLGQDTAALLFRHVRELLTNVIKHARADRVAVHVQTTDGFIEIIVEDNGVGFGMASSEAQVAAGHFGLFSIEVGMADIGGTLEIQSDPGKGCRAVLQLPIKDEGSEVQGSEVQGSRSRGSRL